MKSNCTTNMAVKALVIVTLCVHLVSLIENIQTLRTPDVVFDHTNTIELHANNLEGSALNFSLTRTHSTFRDLRPPTELGHDRPVNALDLKSMYPSISLAELVNTDPNSECVNRGSSDRAIVNSTVIEDITITHPPNRKIPKIIHVTSKTRCMPLEVRTNLDLWRFTNYSFYVHDDKAVDRLLWETYWPEFPHLNLLRPCMVSGAAKADLWRYVLPTISMNVHRLFAS
jgi:mannosyltransferase OCH1-like enzyme